MVSQPGERPALAARRRRAPEPLAERDVTFRELLVDSPPWVGSLIAHLLLAALIGGVVLASRRPLPPAPTADAIQLRLGDPEPAGADPVPVVEPPPPKPKPRAEPPRVGKPSTQDEAPALGAGESATASSKRPPVEPGAIDAILSRVDGARAVSLPHLARRSADGRRRAVAAGGGSAASESAVERGLAWLARHQSPAGHWDSDGYLSCCPEGQACQLPRETLGFASHDVAQTSLALMAFLGAGYHGRQGTPHADTVRRGLRWLIRRQRADGAFAGPGDLPVKFAYHQAMATIALAEAYGLTRRPSLRDPLRRAARLLERQQQPGGGWDYRPSLAERNDSSVTGWVAMALEAARVAGVTVDRKAFAGIVRHIERMSSDDGQLRYQDRDQARDRKPSVALLATGAFLRQLLGQKESPALTNALAALRDDPPDASRWSERDQSLYAWYYGTLAAYLAGGPTWQRWNAALRPALIKTQLRGGHADGSWPARAFWASHGGGRVYATSMAVLCLETYYRYVPELLKDAGEPFADLWSQR